MPFDFFDGSVLGLADWLLVLLYFFLLIWLSVRNRGDVHSEKGFLLSGRTLTLPAFVATLVSTWYGGILGVGEFTWYSGISQWIVFGLPYYIFAAFFAFLLAGKIRQNRALSIPEAILDTYGKTPSKISAIGVFLLVSPAPYILMLGLLFQFLTFGNISLWWFTGFVTVFSVLYVSYSGFMAVVRTDILQIILMYVGFGLLLYYCISVLGNPDTLWSALPDSHRAPTGGHSVPYLLVWFFIALWTFVDPGFHQRAAAAKNEKTARNGILISVVFWFAFDILTLLTGLYGFLAFPELSSPTLVYPELAAAILPAGILGLFFLGILATIMSTLDSFLFLSGQTIGRDFSAHFIRNLPPNTLTRWGVAISGMVGLLMAHLFPSVVSLWYVLGTVVIPGLLVPVLGIYLPFFRISSAFSTIQLVLPSLASLIWLVFGIFFPADGMGYAFLGLEPFYPGLISAVLILGWAKYQK